MAVFNRTEVGIKRIGGAASVPNDPVARLMYYLDCMCSVLQLDDDPHINRLRRFRNYQTLDRSDRDLLISLCILLKPDVLLDKCIFQNDRMCGDRNNAFYELETVRNNLMVAGTVLIGGRQRRVNKIMTFKMAWFIQNWKQPMEILIARQQRERQAVMQQPQTTNACVIL